jgi:predicted  nucleic acid-binding Zn-ribbon protein
MSYMDSMKEQLRDWGIEIDTLRARADKASESARAEIMRRIENLRGMERDAAAKLQDLVKAGMPAWDDLAKGVERTVHEIRTRLETPSRAGSKSRSR